MTKRHHRLQPLPLAAGLAMMLLGSVSAEAWAAQPATGNSGQRSTQAQPYDDREAADSGARRPKLKRRPPGYDQRLAEFHQRIKARRAEANLELAANARQLHDDEPSNALPEDDALPIPRPEPGVPQPAVYEGLWYGQLDESRSPSASTHALARIKRLQDQRTAAEAQAAAMARLQKLPQRRLDHAPEKRQSQPVRRPASQLYSDPPRSGPSRTATVTAPAAKAGPKPPQPQPGARQRSLYQLPAHRDAIRRELTPTIAERRAQAQRGPRARVRAPVQDCAKSRHALGSGGHGESRLEQQPLNLIVPGIVFPTGATKQHPAQTDVVQRTTAESSPQACAPSRPSRADDAQAARWALSEVDALALVGQLSGLRAAAPGTAPLPSLGEAWDESAVDDRQSVHLSVDPRQTLWREEIAAWRELFADQKRTLEVRFEQSIDMAQVPQRESIVAALVRIENDGDGAANYAVVRRAHGDAHWELLGIDEPAPGDAGGRGPTVIASEIGESQLSSVELVVYQPLDE